MTTNTVQLHHVFAAPVAKVFRAFVEADAMASWLPPYGFVCKVNHLEAKLEELIECRLLILRQAVVIRLEENT
ncbi:MAG: hypothetical protein ACOVKP_02630 [Flavobacterium sp.]